MRWREVTEWLDRQEEREFNQEAARDLGVWVMEGVWDAFYTQTFRRPVSLPAARVLLSHSLVALRCSLMPTAAFVAWERLSQEGRPGWHAHCLLSLSCNPRFADCGRRWKSCPGPSPKYTSGGWKLPRNVPERELADWRRSQPNCTLYCWKKIAAEEMLGEKYGWARLDPIRSTDLGVRAYVMKYVLKQTRSTPTTLDIFPDVDNAEILWEYLDADRWGDMKGDGETWRSRR